MSAHTGVWRGTWALLLVACAADPGRAGGLSPELLRGVSEQAVQGGTQLSLEAEAWRSFQPITGESGDPLIVVARLHGTAPLGPQVQVDTLYVVRGSEIWVGRSVEEQARAAGGRDLEVVARNGPAWAAGDSIDVIAEVSTGGGKRVRLRSPRAAIQRVD